MLAIVITALFVFATLLVSLSLADSAVRARHAVRRVRNERRSLAAMGSGICVTQVYPEKGSSVQRAPAKLTVIAGSRRPVRKAPQLAAAA